METENSTKSLNDMDLEPVMLNEVSVLWMLTHLTNDLATTCISCFVSEYTEYINFGR